MNIIESLYEDEDLATDDGIEAICKKIKNLNVSHLPCEYLRIKVNKVLLQNKINLNASTQFNSLGWRQCPVGRVARSAK